MSPETNHMLAPMPVALLKSDIAKLREKLREVRAERDELLEALKGLQGAIDRRDAASCANDDAELLAAVENHIRADAAATAAIAKAENA